MGNRLDSGLAPKTQGKIDVTVKVKLLGDFSLRLFYEFSI